LRRLRRQNCGERDLAVDRLRENVFHRRPNLRSVAINYPDLLVLRNIDSYSTFFDNAHRRETGLADYLEKRKIKDIYLMGLALDYCVKYGTLDARHLGLNTHVIVDGCRGINLEPGDIERALDDMKRVGAVLLQSSEL